MYVRNWKGNIVFIDKEEFNNDYDFYLKLWKIKYNIKLKKKTTDINDIIKYVNGEKDFV